MSIIRDTEVDLTDLIKESNLIVAVKYREPFSEQVAIRVSAGEAEAPPFVKKGVVFEVVDVLMNKDNVKVPQIIKVPEENWRRSLSQYKEAYGGVSKSFSVKKYSSDVSSLKKAAILFLYHFQGSFELTAKNSFASEDAREKIEMLLR